MSIFLRLLYMRSTIVHIHLLYACFAGPRLPATNSHILLTQTWRRHSCECKFAPKETRVYEWVNEDKCRNHFPQKWLASQLFAQIRPRVRISGYYSYVIKCHPTNFECGTSIPDISRLYTIFIIYIYILFSNIASLRFLQQLSQTQPSPSPDISSHLEHP